MADGKVQRLPFRQVIIIGAGFGGIDMACALKRKLNFENFIIYDRNSDIGGTWYDNNYPGCAVDIPGLIYQLSYAPEPNFPRVFPTRLEMLAYLERTVAKYDLYRHVQLNMSWITASWLEDEQRWSVELKNTQTGETFIQECKVLVGAIGHQVDPKDFFVKNKEEFQGHIIPACKYPEALNLKDKNVVVLGNGSTAVQVVPNILKDVKKCVQIQRDAQWILHRPNPPVPQGVRNFLTQFPVFFSLVQQLIFALIECFYPILGRRLAGIANGHQKKFEVPEKYHPLLTPSYTPGCKRLVFAVDYLQCLKDPKIELVQDEIAALRSSSVVTKSGNEYPADVIILCHGFKGDTFYYPLKGRGGITPSKHWDAAGGPSCYKGCAMSGFPNFFSIRGPNVSSGLVAASSKIMKAESMLKSNRQQSVIWFIEATTTLILNAAAPLILDKAALVEVKSSAELAYVNRVQAACKKGFWGRDCHTYYLTESGWNHTVYPWSEYLPAFSKLCGGELINC
ncbi:hypothetical protein S40288_09221 [Stachybotrys chartarum IBT 40288]|nr:hypothetical protein S40288_09221 [Stachybotrys chartarum IBT 40288]